MDLFFSWDGFAKGLDWLRGVGLEPCCVSVVNPGGSLFRSCGEVSWLVILLVARNLR